MPFTSPGWSEHLGPDLVGLILTSYRVAAAGCAWGGSGSVCASSEGHSENPPGRPPTEVTCRFSSATGLIKNLFNSITSPSLPWVPLATSQITQHMVEGNNTF